MLLAIYRYSDNIGTDKVTETVPGINNIVTRIDIFISWIGFRTDPQDRVAYGALNKYELDQKANETNVRDLRNNIFEYANELVKIEGELIWKDEEGLMNEYLLLTDEGFLLTRYEDNMILHDIVTLDLEGEDIETQENYRILGVFRGSTNHNSVYHSGNVYFVEARHIEQLSEE